MKSRFRSSPLWLICMTIATVYSQSKYIKSPEVTCEHIKLIVDYHNEVRQKLSSGTFLVEPKAANMQRLVWDTALASLATHYSKKMVPIHNPHRKDKRYQVGENIFMTSTNNISNTNVEWIRALRGWSNESLLYSYQLSRPNNITGHYEQMIWADTVHVGCGTTHFYWNQTTIRKIYVCNYGPSGNIIDEFPYREDSVLVEFLLLISQGLIPIDTIRPDTYCDNLCCNSSRCEKPYGTRCDLPTPPPAPKPIEFI